MESEDEDNLISDSFDQLIYSYKESLYKTVPLQKGAGGNQWNDTEDTELRLEDAILAGPKWSVLGAFHNLYGMNYDDESTLEDVVVDNIPRLSGDNDVLFDPDASFAQYLDRFGNNLDQISARFNFFGDGQPDSNPRIMDYNLFSVNLSTRMFRRSRTEILL